MSVLNSLFKLYNVEVKTDSALRDYLQQGVAIEVLARIITVLSLVAMLVVCLTFTMLTSWKPELFWKVWSIIEGNALSVVYKL
ncbi:hypothetical protein F3Y22_tig00110597pilonHSYRG00087 [Hibiscus syriacus]|uniref:Uncharacterized protein n=1 Tax=Hibiscus syriacus TaxID=106335 RepID=A0A6A3A3H4_HIBSY|nr:hypothetical protein F3Y22_tig00110597pilonHSYRG00087 [Hibiscus syriacus]